MSVAECFRRAANPFFGILLDCEVGNFAVVVVVADRLKIVLVLVLPAIFKLLAYASAALAETCVANLQSFLQNLPLCGFYSLYNRLVVCLCYALVALAMVIGADIKNRVVFAVVPFDVFSFGLGKREESAVFLFLLILIALLDLCKQPTARDYGVSLQKFESRCCLHF